MEDRHYIEPDIIARRYTKGIKNLFDICLPVVDEAFIFDNTSGKSKLLAQKTKDGNWIISNQNTFGKLKSYDYGNRK